MSGEVWHRIQELMGERGIPSLAELCRVADVGYHAIQNMKKGKTEKPRAENAAKLAHALGVSVPYLLYGDVSADDLDAEDQRLVRAFRKLPPAEQDALLAMLEARLGPRK